MVADAVSREPVHVFLAQFTDDQQRAEAIHLALMEIAGRVRRDLVLISEVALLAREHKVWSKVRRPDGRSYASEPEFFEEVLAFGSERSAYRYATVGELIEATPVPDRPAMRAAITEIGVAKAEILAPVVLAAEPEVQARWFARAKRERVEDLRQHVRDTVTGRPGGFDQGPGERFLRYLLTQTPADSRAMVERVFRLGARAAETRNPVRVFLLMVERFEVDLRDQGVE